MTYFLSGQWNAICDRCGFKFKSSELKKDWQGLMVCEEDYETRHPQDFIRVRTEKVLPEWVRPRPSDVFLVYCTYATSSIQAGYMGAGCATVGSSNNPHQLL